MDKTGEFFREHLKRLVSYRLKILDYLKSDENKSKMVATEYSIKMQKTAMDLLKDNVQKLSDNYTSLINASNNNECFSNIVTKGKEEVLSGIEEALSKINR